jgi:NTE family protein
LYNVSVNSSTRFILGLVLLCLGGSGTVADAAESSEPATAQPSTNESAGAPLSGVLMQTNTGRRPRVGLALGGGGMRGAATVGVLKVLQEAKIPVDYIAGTSIGAVVGGFYSAGMPLSDLEHRFRTASLMKAYMTVPLDVRIMAAPLMYMPRLLGRRPFDGLYYGKRFRNYIDNALTEAKLMRSIETFRIPFAAVATNLLDGTSHRLTKGDFGVAVQASTALPALRKPVPIDGALYCDGGLICNLPTNHVREMGADFVIAVNIDERVRPAPIDDFRVPGSVPVQAVKIDLAAMDQHLSKLADFEIHPNTDGIGLISRSKADGARGIIVGEKAAREALPELKRRLNAAGIKVD